MLIQEMHNKVEVRLQKLASHVYDWIQSEQIDSFINDNILAFVKNRMNTFSQSGKAPFHRNIKNLEDIRTLVVKSPALPTYVDGDVEYFRLRTPGDFMFLVELSTDLSDACKYQTLPAQQDYLEPFAKFNLPFNVEKLTLDAQDLVEFPGHTSELMKFDNHNVLREVLNTEFGDIYKRGGSYEFIAKPGINPSTLGVVFRDEQNALVEEVSVFNNKLFKVYTDQNIKSPVRTRVRIIRSEEFSHYFNHPFAKSTADNPSGVINEDFIEIHSAKRFILRNSYLVYIRKPALVSLYLSKDCDLPEHTHQEIIDSTVADILETIESGRLQSRVSMNTLNE